MTDESIKAENYKEWPEQDYSKENQSARNLEMFRKTGHLLYPPTHEIYSFVRDSMIDHVKNHPQYPKFNWKPKVIDVGCGGGFGTYILSHEADFAWGIDMSTDSIKLAKKLFEKHKNGIYYSSQISFEKIDIRSENREIMKFDIVVCVEVIEHIADYNKTLKFLKDRCKVEKDGSPTEPPNSTIVYISSPNRNHCTIGNEAPKNKKHVREWTPGELYEILTKNFKYVVCMTTKGEPTGLDTEKPIVLFKCEVPIYEPTD